MPQKFRFACSDGGTPGVRPRKGGGRRERWTRANVPVGINFGMGVTLKLLEAIYLNIIV